MRKDAIPGSREGLQTDLLDDELLVYDKETTKVIALNATASLIWSLCDGSRSLGEVEKLLVEAYPEGASRIPAEMADTIEMLVKEGALELGTPSVE